MSKWLKLSIKGLLIAFSSLRVSSSYVYKTIQSKKKFNFFKISKFVEINYDITTLVIKSEFDFNNLATGNKISNDGLKFSSGQLNLVLNLQLYC